MWVKKLFIYYYYLLLNGLLFFTCLVFCQHPHGSQIHNNTRHSSHRGNSHSIDITNFAQTIHRIAHHIDHEACSKEKLEPWQVELEEFVHNPASKTLLYIYYHDAPSKERALQLAHCRNWMHPIHLKVSPYAESQVYRDVFYYLQKYWLDHNISYIVTTSYKILESTGLAMERITRVTLKDYFNYLKIAQEDSFDIIPIVRSQLQLLPHSIGGHGDKFKLGWDALLQGMGYEPNQIRAMDNIHGFYKNSFIVRTSVFLTLTNLMNLAINVIEANSTVNALLSFDAEYPGKMTKEQLEIAFHAPYYKMYPFVLERLPIFFVYHMRYKICDAKNPKCGRNIG